MSNNGCVLYYYEGGEEWGKSFLCHKAGMDTECGRGDANLM